LRASILGFGCASVMGRVGRRDSLRALGAAYDAGVTFFDTARSYGYGESEGLLGEFIAGKRDRVVISTKFGILPVRQSAWKRVAKPLARKVFSLVPGVRNTVKGQIAAQFQPNQFTVDVLRDSLETSLRRLRTDYVDLLFMHSPPASVLEQDDLLGELENLVTAGKVRAAGLSADPGLIAAELLRSVRGLGAVQFPCNLLNLRETGQLAGDAGPGKIIVVTNLPFGGTEGIAQTRLRLRQLAQARETDAALGRDLMGDDDVLLADVVLNVLTRVPGVHIVVPSMMRMEHVRANVNAVSASRFSDDEIASLQKALITGPVRVNRVVR
jgi:aryl-alcohol dehydrogenase-like predicted oxidoreductase